jgi:hypothetical protein
VGHKWLGAWVRVWTVEPRALKNPDLEQALGELHGGASPRSVAADCSEASRRFFDRKKPVISKQALPGSLKGSAVCGTTAVKQNIGFESR